MSLQFEVDADKLNSEALALEESKNIPFKDALMQVYAKAHEEASDQRRSLEDEVIKEQNYAQRQAEEELLKFEKGAGHKGIEYSDYILLAYKLHEMAKAGKLVTFARKDKNYYKNYKKAILNAEYK